MGDLGKKIEAALFMSSGALSLETLARLCKANVPEVREALNELIHDYSERDSALEIRDGSEGFRMAVRPELEEDFTHLASVPELHAGIMKTLAYIAYKQPVLQSDVIRFRNNKAYDHIRVLLEKGFIRKEALGRSFKIYTTKKFLDYFGSGYSELERKKAAKAGASEDACPAVQLSQEKSVSENTGSKGGSSGIFGLFRR